MASIKIIFLEHLSTFIHMYFTKGKEKKRRYLLNCILLKKLYIIGS